MARIISMMTAKRKSENSKPEPLSLDGDSNSTVETQESPSAADSKEIVLPDDEELN